MMREAGTKTVDKNQFLIANTIPSTCPRCNCKIKTEEATKYSRGEVPYKFECPDCGELFDQSCPHCGSKELHLTDGIEECIRCGEVVSIGIDP